MKKRKVIIGIADDAVRVEHPDGGALHILPFDFDSATDYFDSITVERFVFDDKGKILRNEKTGDPSVRVEAPIGKQIEYAFTRVKAIELRPSAEATPNFVELDIAGCEAIDRFELDGEKWVGVDTNGNKITAINIRGKELDPKAIVLSVFKLMGTDNFEIEVFLDEKGNEYTGAEGQIRTSEKKKVRKDVTENYFLWVPRKCAQLGAAHGKAVLEN